MWKSDQRSSFSAHTKYNVFCLSHYMSSKCKHTRSRRNCSSNMLVPGLVTWDQRQYVIYYILRVSWHLHVRDGLFYLHRWNQVSAGSSANPIPYHHIHIHDILLHNLCILSRCAKMCLLHLKMMMKVRYTHTYTHTSLFMEHPYH